VPLVTIVLPARNAARTLLRAVECIQAQTLDGWELVAVDDGSTDSTGDIFAKLSRADHRIRVLSPGRIGLGPALNLGLEHARDAFIAFRCTLHAS